MSSNNGVGAVAAMLLLIGFLFGALAFIIAYLMIGISVLFGFIAFAWSLVCLLAWSHPFRLGKIYVHPDEARAFVIRGVFGAMTVPAFLLFSDVVLDVSVRWEFLAWYIFGGYTLLSVGFEYIFATRKDVPYVYHEAAPEPVFPAHPRLSPPPEPVYLPSPIKPSFANWDDEAEIDEPTRRPSR